MNEKGRPEFDQPLFVIPLAKGGLGSTVLDFSMCPLGPDPHRRCENGSACGHLGGYVDILGWRYVVCMAPAEQVYMILKGV